MTLSSSAFQPAEYERTVWRCSPEAGTQLKDIIEPNYWAHIAAKLRPYDKVEVVAEDGAFYAELLVKECSRTWAKMVPISYSKLSEIVQSENPITRDVVDGYEVVWKGPNRKWSVLLHKAGEPPIIQKEKMNTREEANHWRTDHLKAIQK